jgi:hypothetical protein
MYLSIFLSLTVEEMMSDETQKPEENAPEPYQPPAPVENSAPAPEPFAPPPPPPFEPSFAPPPPPPGQSFAPPPPPKKAGMKWWVILIIVLVVLCCCCVVAGVLLWTFGDQIFGSDFMQEFNRLLINFVA